MRILASKPALIVAPYAAVGANPFSVRDPLANQADADRKVKLGPCSIGGEDLGGDDPNGERQKAAVAQ